MVFFFSFLFFLFRHWQEQARLRLPYGGLWAAIRCVARRGQQRRLNYVPDANTADCSVPLASSIHLSAFLKIPLMRYGICIRSHFEYDALSSQARSALVSLSPVSNPVSAHFLLLLLATPIDALLWRLQNRSTIESAISDRREFTRPWNAPRETIAHEFTISPQNKRARIVPID